MKKQISVIKVMTMAVAMIAAAACSKDEVTLQNDNTMALRIIKVTDQSANEPLAGAVVTASTGGASATTNEKGEATLSVRQADASGVQYTVTKSGYADMVTSSTSISMYKTGSTLSGYVTLKERSGSITPYSGTLEFKLGTQFVKWQFPTNVGADGKYSITDAALPQSVTISVSRELVIGGKTYTTNNYSGNTGTGSPATFNVVYTEQAPATTEPLAVVGFTGTVAPAGSVTITFSRAINDAASNIYAQDGSYSQVTATWDAAKKVATLTPVTPNTWGSAGRTFSVQGTVYDTNGSGYSLYQFFDYYTPQVTVTE
jgi:hypothetical protein